MSEARIIKKSSYNPDVLSCLANLSNDEVFTPPEVANAMLDLLPPEIFSDPNARFLDPACKSGVFLREIAKRLNEGLKEKIPDLQERVQHIFTKQLYAIAITELTSLLGRRSVYCSKDAGSKYSVAHFESSGGNIFYSPTKHLWINGKCLHCGASQSEYSEEKRAGLESHAYQFIHNAIPGEIENMKFDVIIGNPPYQMSTGSNSAQATPLYNRFVTEAKRLRPHFLIMITPSRWFCGGMGLDSFRNEMLNDDRLKVIVDYPNAKDCFPNISIGGGVSYFLWDKEYHGKCLYTNIHNSTKSTENRILNEFPVFVRYNKAINIIHKVQASKHQSLSEIVSSLSPFGIGSSERGHEQYMNGDLVLWSSKGKGFIEKSKITAGQKYLQYYHVMMSKVTGEHANEPSKDGTFKVISRIQSIKPNEVCTFSYFIIGNFDSELENQNLISYLSTRFVRFLLLQAISSINISKEKFSFVPLQDFTKNSDIDWSKSVPEIDRQLYAKYSLTDEEVAFIESMIRPME